MASSTTKQSIRKLATEVRIGGERAFRALHSFKTSTLPSQLFKDFPRVVSEARLLGPLHGQNFANDAASLYGKLSLGSPANLSGEIIWAICRSILLCKTIEIHSAFAHEFENILLQGDAAKASRILDEARKRTGVSLWWIQAKLLCADQTNDAELLKRQIREVVDSCPSRSFAQFMVEMIARRTEAKGNLSNFEEELDRVIKGLDPVAAIYIRCRLLEGAPTHPSEIVPLLLIDAQATAVDHFEALVGSLRLLSRKNIFAAELQTLLREPLRLLYRKTRDPRLVPLLRAMGIEALLELTPPPSRIAAFEQYFCGDYGSARAHAAKHLESEPTDAICVVLMVRSALRVGQDIPAIAPVIDLISAHLSGVLQGTESAYGDANAILATCKRFAGHSWATCMRNSVEDILDQETTSLSRPSLWDALVADKHLSPLALLCSRSEVSRKIDESRSLRALFPSTFAAIDLLRKGHTETPLPSATRKALYLSRHFLATQQPISALAQLDFVDANGEGNSRIYALRTLAYLQLADFARATYNCVQAHLANPHLPSILPLQEIAVRLIDPATWPQTIDTALTFELYNTFCSGDKLADLRLAFEKFQIENDIGTPAELVARSETIGCLRVIQYLDRVWQPNVMRQTLLYESSAEIEDARIEVCRQLALVDAQNAAQYFEEIKDRVKRREISKATTMMEQSKVYVDVAAIKRNLRARISGQYVRYRASAPSKGNSRSGVMDVITRTVSELSKTNQISVAQLLSSFHLMEDIPESEIDNQFDAIFSEITNEFLKGEHGLNAYLSTRVRHGTLANTLRKPLVDEQLVTSRQSGGELAPNWYWDSRLEEQPISVRGVVQKALREFTENFEAVVSYTRDELIQIRIVRGVGSLGANSRALFVYMSSNIERQYMQRYAIELDNIDDFVDRCVDILWEKTDRNLNVVQKTLESEVWQKLNSICEKLLSDIDLLPNTPVVADLRNHVNRARTNLHARIKEVGTWFKRDQVYDREDYSLSFPLEIATNMIRKTLPDQIALPEIKEVSAPSSDSMPGRTLDCLVDAFFCLISNAIEHSGLDTGGLKIGVSLRMEGDVYLMDVMNNVSEHVVNEGNLEKLAQIREIIAAGDQKHRAQGEGGTGLLKLWRSINSPFYSKPDLRFVLDKKGFNASLSFEVLSVP